MKSNIRSRNITINSYMGILLITLAGAAASFFILHVANDLPLQSVVLAGTQLSD